MFVCLFVCVSACVCVFLCLCVRVCICVYHEYVIHKYIYIYSLVGKKTVLRFFYVLFLFQRFSVISNFMLYLNVWWYDKVRYTIMPGACGWAGAVIEKVTWAFGQE